MSNHSKKINPATWQKTPWKNGAGTTVQLAIAPASATLKEPFFWRVAVAEMKMSGAYSQFSSYSRCLVPLAGSSISLRHGLEMPYKSLKIFTPYAFSGDDFTEAKIEGASLDLNVMVKREWGSQHVTSRTVNVTETHTHSLQGSACMVFCAEGGFENLALHESLVFDDITSLGEKLSFTLREPHVIGRLIIVEIFKNN